MENSILNYIGNTPLIKARQTSRGDVDLYFKLEGFNPGGSIKDRVAYSMITEALKRGDIDKNTHLVEATSGNTGIALAYIAQILGMKISLIMPENATKERIKIMRAYGAEVILTDADLSMEGSIDLAYDLVKTDNYYLLDQFSNDDNWKAHYRTTGPEIWKQTKGKITHLVSSMGTTGTITGTSKFLKEQNPNIKIIGVQPNEGSNIPGIKKWDIGYLPAIYDDTNIDRIELISTDKAIEMTHFIASKESIFGGMSSGAAAFIAQGISQEIKQGLIVSIVPDRGDRYLSSGLF